MFKQLVFYMEACESGSMFPDLQADGKILAVTASNAQEPSSAIYCGDAAVVKGKNIGSCLGDLFSVNWMELASETFRFQISKVTKLTNQSHVCSFGDKSFENETIGGVEVKGAALFEAPSTDSSVDTRDIYVSQAFWAWQNAPHQMKSQAWTPFVDIISDRERDDRLFAKIGGKACADSQEPAECQKKMLDERAELKDRDCHYTLAHVVHEHCPVSASHHATGGWNGYNMKYSQELVDHSLDLLV